ncbi:hypothetical protein A3A71_00780 [Candidatus Berkelbacteria bacterium RIFCSPLOWO2_01_FULL_50_28]|uniref:Polymerase nucleotidyl transferase domain-containing protein n=1 Tax=Candidatus Berkelbacteria bacterium RIFCSPLOWO2_01_FULL_50_28 TaxID=1797471 RepID=A0A1F5EBD0_9BACT|nr:MAG: hypothetical protein A2807_01350 [Candidatus Berkelbacteria bacterium RIFCSPHIGHO2_01_FULL_50_36]OGD62883.1 MAG: hypothetical protein A3F39_03940 [Candidatus Berkelbacteria bacterium RIFCSPHIGHO2_12_FULL_50_11]OGD64576.1 MAG: hypothetical protein A3A71_00780 [Candidatus Berkelbacteria bacterium RIFCSPLOWO2_01_FULL_50_28]
MLQELADRVMTHPPFRDGTAVVFGSVAWGTQTWRSDLDIAINSPEDGRGSLRYHYPYDYHDASEAVRVEVENVFSQSRGNVIQFLLVEVLGSQMGVGNYDHPRISPSTSDHFKLLAKVKGGPWSKFNRRIKLIGRRDRKDDVVKYAGTIARVATGFFQDVKEGHRVNVFDARSLQALENFPKQLTRKLLGLYEALPCPDTFDNIMQTLSETKQGWARQLLELYQPFFDIHNSYTKLVDDIFDGSVVLDEAEYNRRLVNYLRPMPFAQVGVTLGELFPDCSYWKRGVDQLRYTRT